MKGRLVGGIILLIGGVIIGVYGYDMLEFISVKIRLGVLFGVSSAKSYVMFGQILLIAGIVVAILGFILTVSAIVKPKKKW